jgi:hypothetical protein
VNGILDAAVDVNWRFEAAGFRYCLIGGIALQRWGQPRMTLDVDVTVMTDFGSEGAIVERILQWFPPRIADAAGFARQSRVLLVTAGDGVGVDVTLGAIPYESRMIDRSSLWHLSGQRSLRTCSAEDLVVQKTFAGRDQDWVDIRAVVQRQGDSLDRALVLRELEPLLELKEDLEGIRRLKELFDVSA